MSGEGGDSDKGWRKWSATGGEWSERCGSGVESGRVGMEGGEQ